MKSVFASLLKLVAQQQVCSWCTLFGIRSSICLIHHHTEGEDYVVTPGNTIGDPPRVQLRFDPVQVNVTLLRDGIGGEGTEDIVVTLRLDMDFSPAEDFRVLVNPTIRITVQDNDSML